MNAPWYAVLFPVAVALGGCSDAPEPVASGEVAARVNDAAISLRQVDQAMAAAAEGLSPEQLGDARDAVLESLIDEELMVQKARARRLDHTPEVSREIEAARRQILARAYLEQVTAVDPRPSSVEIRKFYASHPALFAERRIYNLQEIAIRIAPDRYDELRQKVGELGDLQKIAAWLGEQKIPFNVSQAVKAAEQLPLDNLPNFAQMKDGQFALTRAPAGAALVVLAGTRAQPLDKTAARPFIEQYLANARKAELAKAELKHLRETATIEYVGDFAASAPKAMAAAAVPQADGVIAPALPAAAPAASVGAASDAPAAPLGAPAEAMRSALEKGAAGLR